MNYPTSISNLLTNKLGLVLTDISLIKLQKLVLLVIIIGLLTITGSYTVGYAQSSNLTVAEALAERKGKAASSTEQVKNPESKNTIKKASVSGSDNVQKGLTNISSTTSAVGNGGSTGFYQDPTVSLNTSRNDYTSLWINLILIMGVFCGSGYLILRYLKKRNLNHQSSSSQLFSPIAEFTLGMNKKLQIIKILNDYYVLTIGQDEVNLLNKVEDKESIDLLTLEANKKPASNFFEDSFKNYVNAGSWSPTNVTKALKNKVRGL